MSDRTELKLRQAAVIAKIYQVAELEINRHPDDTQRCIWRELIELRNTLLYIP